MSSYSKRKRGKEEGRKKGRKEGRKEGREKGKWGRESGEVDAVKEKAGEMLGGRGSGWTVDERASAHAFLYQLRKEHSSCHLWLGRSWISGGV